MAVLTKGFAAERGDELALADDDGTLTWSELDGRVNQTIHAFRSAGIESGDTISVVSGNRNEWFEIMLASANMGVTVVPINWHLVAPEIAYILDDSDSKAVVAGHQFVDVVAKAPELLTWSLLIGLPIPAQAGRETPSGMYPAIA